jgi:acyl-CoA thioester hydrolase
VFENQGELIEGYKFVLKMPIQFQNIDGMGHCNNVSYFSFLETTRLEYHIQLMQLQEGIHEMNNMPFILGGQSIIYRSPALFRENLLIGLRTSWIKRSSFGFEYEMREGRNLRLIAEGGGTHVMFDYLTQRSMPMPEEWINLIENFEGRKLRG